VKDAVVASASISDQPLSVVAALQAVTQPDVGGSVVFVGTVRDHDAGREVAGLTYSAHPSALELMQQVLDEVAAEFPRVHLAVTHRVGELTIGDLAVVVAAGAAHRADAFRAASALIDRVKTQVPIWKHQRFADGTEVWVGSLPVSPE
jgi:molybdopterin synthase catalytic subunit